MSEDVNDGADAVQAPAAEATGDGTTYAYRRNALEKAQTLSLTDAGITVTPEGGAPWQIAWEEVASVRLQFAPTRVATSLYLCTVTTRNGRTLKIHSMSFSGFANFDDQRADYCAFLREMHRRLAAANASVAYKLGSSPATFWSLLGCNVLIFSFLIILMIAMAFAMPPIALVKLVIVIIYIPLLISWFKKNKPGTYDPLGLPESMMPR